jgi:hypothetical protein
MEGDESMHRPTGNWYYSLLANESVSLPHTTTTAYCASTVQDVDNFLDDHMLWRNHPQLLLGAFSAPAKVAVTRET